MSDIFDVSDRYNPYGEHENPGRGIVLALLVSCCFWYLLYIAACTEQLIVPIGDCTFTVTRDRPVTLSFEQIERCAGSIEIQMVTSP
jgi:hypothetical protein